MKTILITAFEKFGHDSINVSEQVALLLDGMVIGSHRVKTVILPCVFFESIQALEKSIVAIKPDMVISLGQASGRTCVTPEMVAINLNDARIPDNKGYQAVGSAVIDDAPAAYFSTLPVRAVVADLVNRGIPAAISYTAGTFVCNHLFFGLMHLAKQYHIEKAGFVHIPCLPEQAMVMGGQPLASMSLDTLKTAIQSVIDTCVSYHEDIAVAMGNSH